MMNSMGSSQGFVLGQRKRLRKPLKSMKRYVWLLVNLWAVWSILICVLIVPVLYTVQPLVSYHTSEISVLGHKWTSTLVWLCVWYMLIMVNSFSWYQDPKYNVCLSVQLINNKWIANLTYLKRSKMMKCSLILVWPIYEDQRGRFINSPRFTYCT